MKRLSLRELCPDLPAAFDAVTLWQIDLDASLLAARDAVPLQPDELERAARFVFDRDRQRYLEGRRSLRWLLAQQLHVPVGDICIGYGPFGRPHLVDPPAPLDFNVSHSQQFALVACCKDGPVGVDVEWRRPLPERIELAQAHFTPQEQAALRACGDEEDAQRCFFRIWTRKEAVLKAWGCGLSRPTSDVEVGSGSGGCIVTAPEGDGAPALQVISLRLVDNPQLEAAVSLGSRAGPL